MKSIRRASSHVLARLVTTSRSKPETIGRRRSIRNVCASSEAPPWQQPTALDINSATKINSKELPGIGDAYSQKIIDGRPTASNPIWYQERSSPRPPTTKSRT